MDRFTMLSNGDLLYLVTDDGVICFKSPMLTEFSTHIQKGKPVYSGLSRTLKRVGKGEISAEFSIIATEVTHTEGNIDSDMLFKDDVLDNMTVNELLDSIGQKVKDREN